MPISSLLMSVPRNCCDGCPHKLFASKNDENPELAALRGNCWTLKPWQLLLVGKGLGGWKLTDVASHLTASIFYFFNFTIHASAKMIQAAGAV